MFLLLTIHLVALHEALILLVNNVGGTGEVVNVIVQVPAQILIKHCGQEVELFIIVPLHEGKKRKEKKTISQVYWGKPPFVLQLRSFHIEITVLISLKCQRKAPKIVHVPQFGLSLALTISVED